MRPEGVISRKDISVKELRHIIPLLIMDVYGFKDEPAQKKGRKTFPVKLLALLYIRFFFKIGALFY